MVPTPAPPLEVYATRLRAEIGAALQRSLEFDPGCPARLHEALVYSLLAPGKRLRPMLVLMACEACGCDRQTAMPAALAVEMVHTYSLVHDDLPAMDDDDIRRGQATCHVKFDEATAILVGDALLTRAFEILARDLQPPPVAARCCVELAQAAGAAGMVGGQADDLAFEFQGGELSELEAIHRRKTGAMIRVSLRLGALAAQAAPAQLAALNQYGEKLGLAFQITDDLLDVQGEESAVGKRTRKDSHRGKLTFPAMLGIAESRRRAVWLVDQACADLALLGSRAAQLESLARYVIDRTH